MSRTPVSLRQATVADVPFLVDLWSETLRRADRHDQVADLELIVKAAAQSSEQRLVIADYDGEPAGAVLLSVTSINALNLEPCVQAHGLQVATHFQRKGVGRLLMEAAVTYAEDLGIGHVVAAANASSRIANRFMARLSLGPWATVRGSTTHAVRAQLTAQMPSDRRSAGGRQLGQVLGARRQLRRRGPAGPAHK